MEERIRVLYAEDSRIDADLTKTQLEVDASNFAVEVVGTGRECVARLAEERFDVLLLDNRLPDMDGTDVLKELSGKQILLPVVFVTGVGDEDLVVKVLRLGACDYVPKEGDYVKSLPAILRNTVTEFRSRQQKGNPASTGQGRILYVESNELDVDLTLKHFSEAAAHLHLTTVYSSTNALTLLEKDTFDLVLCDLRMPDMSALDLLREMKRRGLMVPFIVITGRGDEGAAIAALKLGAYDYIIKRDSYLTQLPYAIENAIARSQLIQANHRLRTELDQRERAEMEKAQLLAEVIKQRQRLDDIISNVPGFIWEIWGNPDAVDHTIGFVSSYIEQMLGYSVDSLTGRGGWQSIIHPGDRSRVRRQNAEWFTSGTGGNIQFRWIAKDGRVVWIETRATVICDDKGKSIGMRGLALDITASKEAELAREQLEEQLKQSQKLESLGRLAGGVAHDFNNLLNVVIGYASLLQSDPDEGKSHERAAEILKASSRATSLVRQMLAFSRRQVLQLETTDLNEIITDLGTMLRRLIGENIELQIQTASNLPCVMADASQIEQVIMNLVVNARDAMPRGGQLTIATTTTEFNEEQARTLRLASGPYVVVKVNDTGHGMDSDTQARIFEPYFTTKEAGKGTGLGLATVHGIVAQSGGAMRVQSEVGVGTTFSVYLPANKKTAQVITPPLVLKPKTRTAGTILLAEDEESLRTLTKEVLQSVGYTVLEAANGASALETASLHRGTVQMLITDMVMPGMHGSDLAARIQDEHPGIRVLCITGYAEPSIVKDLGAAILEKPFTPDALLSKVDEILSTLDKASDSRAEL
jgi:PAS domain S-box-containing protein